PEHDVLRLEITMNHSSRMREGHGVAHLEEGTQQLCPRPRSAHDILEPPASDPLHDIEQPPVRKRPDVVYRNDAGVLERRENSRLANDALPFVRGRCGVAQQLEGDIPIQLPVASEIHTAHPAFPDQLTDVVSDVLS